MRIFGYPLSRLPSSASISPLDVCTIYLHYLSTLPSVLATRTPRLPKLLSCFRSIPVFPSHPSFQCGRTLFRPSIHMRTALLSLPASPYLHTRTVSLNTLAHTVYMVDNPSLANEQSNGGVSSFDANSHPTSLLHWSTREFCCAA